MVAGSDSACGDRWRSAARRARHRQEFERRRGNRRHANGRRGDNQRTYVAEWTIQDIQDIFTLREMLEGYAAARTAERAKLKDYLSRRSAN